MAENGIGAMLQLFPEAVCGGVLIAAVCALLGVFVILKRVVFIGITLSEVAACGIAIALARGLPPVLGASVLTLLAVLLLAQPFELQRVPRDAILGVIFVLAASTSILVVSKSGFGLHDVKTLLYGDLILTSRRDLVIIAAVLVPVCLSLLLFLRPTLYVFLDRDGAQVMGLRVRFWELLYFTALGLAVSATSKVAGSLLVFCFLVVAPAAALLLSKRLGIVLIVAATGAVVSTVVGMYISFGQDLPTNQTVAVATCVLFLLAAVWAGARTGLRRLRGSVRPERVG